MFLYQPDYRPPVIRFSHDFHVGFRRQQTAEPVTHDLVVIRQYDLDHLAIPA
jgi:hypothetical protein